MKYHGYQGIRREKLVRFFQRQPRWLITCAGVVACLIIGMLDYATGWDVSFATFYVFPIVFSAWFGGKEPALAIALIGVLLRVVVGAYDRHVYPDVILMNLGMRSVLFITIALLAGNLHEALRRESGFARRDPLVGIGNFRFFQEVCGEELERLRRYKRPFSVAYLDIDNFKSVNDTQGHDAGNALLISVAQCIKRQLRATDSVARLSGDEFAILLRESADTNARAVMARVFEQLRNMVVKNKWPVTFSAGVVVFEQAPGSVNEALKLADRCMYRIKNSTKDGLAFEVYRVDHREERAG